MFGLIKGADSVELKLTVPGGRSPLDGHGARHGPARRADPPGVLLRHARPGARPARASSSGPAASSARATTRSSSCGRSCRTSCRRSCARRPSFGVEVDAMPGGYVCSASLKASLAADRGVARPLERRPAAAQAVHQGAAGVLRRARARRHRARRSGRARADLRAQAEVHARRTTSASSSPSSGSTRTSSRILELSTKCAPADAFQTSPKPGFLREPRRRSLGRAADEDQDGAQVLLEEPPGSRFARLT